MTISEFSSLPVHSKVTVKGWVKNWRSSGKIFFAELRDGSGYIQAIATKKDVTPEVYETLQKITIESSVIVEGTLELHPKKNEYELHVSSVQLLQQSPEYPVGKKNHGPDFLLNHRHLWLRTPRQWAIQRVRHHIQLATAEFFNAEGFTRIDSPILTPSACEGTTELFSVPYFDETAYLSQSGQLYLEAAIMSFGKVYDFGPVFRAEKSKTRRHLTEFWMMDAEMAFYEHAENIALQEKLICEIISSVLNKCEQELSILERDISALEKVKSPFPRLTHSEAVKKLRTLGSDIGERDDLGADDETLLTKQYDTPIFIEKYPAEVKAFYMKPDPEDTSRVLNSDLLAPEGYGEIIGGSQREDDYSALVKKIDDHALPQEAFSWYCDLRKYGSVPHSGFGYGLERITAWLCGIPHIRETIPFPRMINRLQP